MSVDITIQETRQEVDITVNQNIIAVTVTRTSGAGGSQTWAQTLNNGRNTGGFNPLINNGDKIELENNSYISKGAFNEGTGGNGGVARTCAVGYEDKWEAGEQYVTEIGSTIKQFKRYAFNTPTVNDDVTKRYAVGSFWQMRNNDLYICDDATEDAAIWRLYSVGTTPNLTQVLTQSDIEAFFTSIPNNSFLTFQLSDRLTQNYYQTGNVGSGGVFLDKTLVFPINSVIRFCAGYANTDVTQSEPLLPYKFTSDAYVYYQGSLITELNLGTSDKCFLKKLGVDDIDGFDVWILEVVSKEQYFELQFTQTLVDEPPTIVSGSIKGNRGATITPSRVGQGVYRYTASLPIFADLKNCYKRTDYFDLNTLAYSSPFSTFGWYWYCVSDTVLEVVTLLDLVGGGAADELITNPVLLKGEYKQ